MKLYLKMLETMAAESSMRPPMDRIVIGPPPRGMSQRARRRRRVRLDNGMMIELPDGMHPTLFVLAGSDERARMIAKALGIVDDARAAAWQRLREDLQANRIGVDVVINRRTPPGHVYMMMDPPPIYGRGPR